MLLETSIGRKKERRASILLLVAPLSLATLYIAPLFSPGLSRVFYLVLQPSASLATIVAALVLRREWEYKSRRRLLEVIVVSLSVFYIALFSLGFFQGFALNRGALVENLLYNAVFIVPGFIARGLGVGVVYHASGGRKLAALAYSMAVFLSPLFGPLKIESYTSMGLEGLALEAIYSILPIVLFSLVVYSLAVWAPIEALVLYLAGVGSIYYLLPVLPALNHKLFSFSLSVLHSGTLVAMLDRLEAWLPLRRIREISAKDYATIALVVLGFLLALSQGYRVMVVGSGSMEPSLPLGSIVLVVPVEDATSIEKGEIVAYVNQFREIVVHRVAGFIEVGGKTKYIVTKGDANEYEDKPISPKQVIGKVALQAPRLGLPLIYAAKALGGTLNTLITTIGLTVVMLLASNARPRGL